MREIGVNGCTDITGFSLLGHSYEMAKASGATLKIMSEKVPLLPDVLELIEQKMLTRGDTNNRVYIGENIKINESVTTQMQSALFDPQTAGGLLISIEKLEGAKIIGEVEEFSDFLIKVE
jgi:selenide,water dikinase